MSMHDQYLDLLERQASDVMRAELLLKEARSENWRVLEAELELESRVRAYQRILDEAPPIVLRFHVQHRLGV